MIALSRNFQTAIGIFRIIIVHHDLDTVSISGFRHTGRQLLMGDDILSFDLPENILQLLRLRENGSLPLVIIAGDVYKRQEGQ